MTPKEVAKKGVKLLPALCNHLEAASGFFQVNIISGCRFEYKLSKSHQL